MSSQYPLEQRPCVLGYPVDIFKSPGLCPEFFIVHTLSLNWILCSLLTIEFCLLHLSETMLSHTNCTQFCRLETGPHYRQSKRLSVYDSIPLTFTLQIQTMHLIMPNGYIIGCHASPTALISFLEGIPIVQAA